MRKQSKTGKTEALVAEVMDRGIIENDGQTVEWWSRFPWLVERRHNKSQHMYNAYVLIVKGVGISVVPVYLLFMET